MKAFNGLVVNRADDISTRPFHHRFVLKKLVDGRFVVCRKGKAVPKVGQCRRFDPFFLGSFWDEVPLRYA